MLRALWEDKFGSQRISTPLRNWVYEARILSELVAQQ
jgi:hypothetical protein